MKLKFGKLSKTVLVLTAAMALTSCGSIGGFSELLGISNEGIDSQNIEVNDPLQSAGNGDLPTPEGAVLNTVPITNAAVSTPQIVAPIIVAPKIIAPKIVKPIVVVPVAPKVVAPKVTTPKVEVKPIVAANPVVAPTKISPLAYKFVDLFTFRSDMRVGKLLNPLATAKRIADNAPQTCKLAGDKFTCGEYFITVK